MMKLKKLNKLKVIKIFNFIKGRAEDLLVVGWLELASW
jgi:hypothetical protein